SLLRDGGEDVPILFSPPGLSPLGGYPLSCFSHPTVGGNRLQWPQRRRNRGLRGVGPLPGRGKSPRLAKGFKAMTMPGVLFSAMHDLSHAWSTPTPVVVVAVCVSATRATYQYSPGYRHLLPAGGLPLRQKTPKNLTGP